MPYAPGASSSSPTPFSSSSPSPDTAPNTAAATARRVGVVTVSYGSAEALEVFLSSLREHHGNDVPVIVVDNKPDHENVEALARRFGADYLPLPENPGYGAGMNAGARELVRTHSADTATDESAAGSTVSLPGRPVAASLTGPTAEPNTVSAGGSADPFDAFFYCNPDLRFLEPTIGRLAVSLLAHPRAGSIGPQLLNEDGSVYPSARNIPSVGTGIGHALFGGVWPGNPWSRVYKNASNYGSARDAGWLSGAAVMVERRTNDEIGGWDEAYFMHFEDVDLGWRIGRTGRTNRYEPAVAVEHSGAHSTKKHAVRVERAMTASAIRFMGKRYPGPLRAPLRWAITLGLRVRGALKVRAAKRQ